MPWIQGYFAMLYFDKFAQVIWKLAIAQLETNNQKQYG